MGLEREIACFRWSKQVTVHVVLDKLTDEWVATKLPPDFSRYFRMVRVMHLAFIIDRTTERLSAVVPLLIHDDGLKVLGKLASDHVRVIHEPVRESPSHIWVRVHEVTKPGGHKSTVIPVTNAFGLEASLHSGLKFIKRGGFNLHHDDSFGAERITGIR